MITIKNKSWKKIFDEEQSSEYYKTINNKYNKSIENNIVYPEKENIFKAFELTNFNNIKVVIIGQDSYYSLCKKANIPFANGLAFSVNKECNLPPSLKNIFKQLNYNRTNGDLTDWAKQGVLLLNTQLSVVKGKPNSHRFWKKFTDNIITHINDKLNNVIFVLWGGNALKKLKIIDQDKHHLFISSHPSPLGFKKKLKTYQPFYNSDIFNNINKKLKELNKKQIKW